MTGTLKARVGGVWVPILGSGQEAAATARWNSSWGLVAMGVMTNVSNAAVPISTVTDVTLPLSFTPLTGRKYRLVCRVRAVGPSVAGACVLRVIATGITGAATDFYRWLSGQFDGHDIEWVFDGNGAACTFKVVIYSSATAMSIFTDTASNSSQFYIEDMGPVTPASIAPPTAGPRVVASGNALGIVAMGSFVTPQTPFTIPASTKSVITNVLTFTTVVGRRYRIKCLVRALGSTANKFAFSLNDAGAITQAGDYYIWVGGQYQMANVEFMWDGDDVTHTFTVSGLSTSQTDLFFDTGRFYIEDVGPNTSPALPIPATPPAWTPVTFQNGWTTDARRARYRKIGDVVTLEGIVIPGTATTITTLPAGFRPSQEHSFSAYGATAGTHYITVQVSGNVFATNATDWHFLNGVSFSTT